MNKKTIFTFYVEYNIIYVLGKIHCTTGAHCQVWEKRGLMSNILKKAEASAIMTACETLTGLTSSADVTQVVDGIIYCLRNYSGNQSPCKALRDHAIRVWRMFNRDDHVLSPGEKTVVNMLIKACETYVAEAEQ